MTNGLKEVSVPILELEVKKAVERAVKLQVMRELLQEVEQLTPVDLIANRQFMKSLESLVDTAVTDAKEAALSRFRALEELREKNAHKSRKERKRP